MKTHCSCPQAQHLHDSLYRIWFAPRDAQNRTYCGWLDIDLERPLEVLRLAQEPALGPGGLGTFDERGAMFSWLVDVDGLQHLYYTGWNVGDTVPFRNAVGLATAPAGHTRFSRVGPGPVVDRGPRIPFFAGNPCVLEVAGQWHLWFLSGTAWHAGRNGERPWSAYNLRHAISADGIEWSHSPNPALDFAHPGEMAIARPSVVHDDGLFRMWFCFRGREFAYRLGYAESQDGVVWERMDDLANVSPSSSGWDSQMVAYPSLLVHAGQHYLLYCGNGFSREGFGIAVLEE